MVSLLLDWHVGEFQWAMNVVGQYWLHVVEGQWMVDAQWSSNGILVDWWSTQLVNLVDVIWLKASVKCWSTRFNGRFVQSIDCTPSTSNFKIDDYWSMILVEGTGLVLVNEIQLEVSIFNPLHTIDEQLQDRRLLVGYFGQRY